MHIDHTQLPEIHIACHRLKNAIDLKRQLKDFTKGVYCIYAILHGVKIILKYGYTALEPNGERVYRQIWRCPGWPTEPATTAAGEDFDWTVSHFPNLHKDDVYIQIWDMSHIEPINPYRPEYEPYLLEGQFIREYIERYGSAPIGNKMENNRIQRGLVPRITRRTVNFHHWFEESARSI